MQEQNLPKPVTPEGPTPSVEVAPTGSKHEQVPIPAPKPEIASANADSVNQAGPAPQFSAANLPQPIAIPQVPVQAITDDSITSLPAVADDVDVIEKVWVDKAKTIVRQTKDDPYAQEKQVSILQDDYQKKRYGKDQK